MERDTKTSGNLALSQPNRVLVIPAQDEITARKLRVAAYARVSSSSDDQLNSYRAQNQYYSELISSNPDWEMVDIYADSGITGTSAEKREDFQRMMQDCRKGKIDRILVKSISRFARNTKDCLAAVRELKERGISVLFEEQGIDTAQVSSEMITAIMASLAQAESESISGNIQWSYQKRMQNGEFNTCKAPYGFRLENGKLIIHADEAIVVQRIFDMFLNGKNQNEIAEVLRLENVPTRKDVAKWSGSTVYRILRNERYAGNALLCKFYTTNSFPHKKVQNHGEREQYFIHDANPAIISETIFERTQALLAHRSSKTTSLQQKQSPTFEKRLICQTCGCKLKRKISNQKEYWVCYNHFDNKYQCPLTPIPTSELQDAFCRLYWKLKHHGEPIFSQMLSNLQKIRNARMLWSEDVVSLNRKISDTLSQIQLLTQLQQQGMVDPDTFISQNNKLSEQLRRWKQEKARLLDTDSDDMVERTRDIMDTLTDGPDFLDHFDAELFAALVEKIIVESNTQLRFRLINGVELTEQIERTRR